MTESVAHPTRSDGSPIRVLVVDDHKTFAQLLVIALESKPDLVCVGAATTAAEAIDLAARSKPDVVVMDIQLGADNGLDATRQILARRPETVVVIVTAHSDPDWLAQAAQAGASAFVPKSGSLKDMLAAIRDATSGSMLLAPSLFERPPGTPARAGDMVGPLTAREHDVLSMMGRGAATSEIARTLNISLHTCRGYVKGVHLKLGVRSQLEAVVKAHQLGLITLSSDG